MGRLAINFAVSFFGCLFVVNGDAFAWGDEGHKIVCEIALRLVQPNTRADGLLSETCPGASACVVTAIGKDFEVLKSTAASPAQKLASLKFLGHWVGDIHQPLHVSFEDDRGGNSVLVTG